MTKRRLPDRVFEFPEDDPAAAVGLVAEMSEARRGWVNFQPAIHPEDEVTSTSPLSLIFGGRGYVVPVCSWVSGGVGRNGPKPNQVGIQHSTGSKVLTRLVESGHPAPQGWRWLQDNPRRGLVASLPDDVDPGVVVRWLLGCGRELSGVPITGHWRAIVFGTGKASPVETGED